jgi:hypothetical protein
MLRFRFEAEENWGNQALLPAVQERHLGSVASAVENACPGHWIRHSFIQLNRPVPLPIQISVHERQARG